MRKTLLVFLAVLFAASMLPSCCLWHDGYDRGYRQRGGDYPDRNYDRRGDGQPDGGRDYRDRR